MQLDEKQKKMLPILAYKIRTREPWFGIVSVHERKRPSLEVMYRYLLPIVDPCRSALRPMRIPRRWWPVGEIESLEAAKIMRRMRIGRPNLWGILEKKEAFYTTWTCVPIKKLRVSSLRNSGTSKLHRNHAEPRNVAERKPFSSDEPKVLAKKNIPSQIGIMLYFERCYFRKWIRLKIA